MAFDDGVKTVSGSVAHTDDAATKVPFVSVKCGIEPTLSGVSLLTETQTGRNLASGGVYEYNARNMIITPVYLKAGTYTVSFNRGVNVQYIYIRKGETVNLVGDAYATKSNSTFFTFTADEDTYYYAQLYRTNTSDTWEDYPVTQPQIEYGSTATAYEPYQTPTQYTASLGRTIYGGQADIVNGEGQETHGKKVFDGTEGTGGTPSWTMISVSQGTMFRITVSDKVTTSATNTICSYYTPVAQAQRADGTVSGAGTNVDIIDNRFSSVDAFKAWLAENPVTLVYELATPTDFTFTPITPTPETVGKVNNVYCNTGNTELTYYDNAHGFSEVTVNNTGKNLFNKNAVANNTWIIVNSTETEPTNSYSTSDYIPVKANTKYFVSFKDSNRSAYYDKNKNGIAYFTFNGNASFTALYDGYIRITIKNDIDLDTFIVNEGSEAIPYEPFGISKTAYLHKVIYGGQADVVKGTCEPKNLVDFLSNIEPTYSGFTITVTSDYGINFSGTGTRTWAHLTKTIPCDFAEGTKLVFSIQENKTYNIYVQFTYDDATTQNFTIAGNVVTDNVAFTLPKKAVSVRMDVALLQASTEHNETLYCMVEKGTAKTDFAPYFAPFTFPPISIGTDEGENTLFANEGASSITYRKAVD